MPSIEGHSYQSLISLCLWVTVLWQMTTWFLWCMISLVHYNTVSNSHIKPLQICITNNSNIYSEFWKYHKFFWPSQWFIVEYSLVPRVRCFQIGTRAIHGWVVLKFKQVQYQGEIKFILLRCYPEVSRSLNIKSLCHWIALFSLFIAFPCFDISEPKPH